MFPSLIFIVFQACVLWVASLRLRDSSLMDRFWGSSFVVVMFILFTGGAISTGTAMLLFMISLWGLRLSYHVTVRNWGKGEDPRYFAIRESISGYPWKSFFMVFLFQGGLVAIVSLPLFSYAAGKGNDSWGWMETIGTSVWALGLLVEIIADEQLRRYRVDDSPNKKEVMDRGLWALSRHPNYVGEALIWWGIWAYTFSFESPWAIFSPILMTWLLRYFTGVEHLERHMFKTRKSYSSYAKKVPVFWPKPIGRTS